MTDVRDLEELSYLVADLYGEKVSRHEVVNDAIEHQKKVLGFYDANVIEAMWHAIDAHVDITGE